MMSNLSLRALRHQLIIPDFRGFTTKIDEIFTASRKITSGKNADYIPQVCTSIIITIVVKDHPHL